MQATVSLQRPAPTAGATVVQAAPTTYTVKAAPRPAKRRGALWLGLAAVLLALAGGGYYIATRPSVAVLTAEQKAAAEKAEQERQELARLRAEAAARQKAEQDAASKRQADDQARQKADAEQTTRRQVEAERRLAAEAAEGQLLLQPSDRQRVQAALTALGYDTRGTDGAFNPRTREMIAAWQGAKGHPATGFLTAGQYEAVLREAAPALAAAAPVPPPTPSPSPGVTSGVDGLWRGTYHCTPSRIAGDFTMHVQINVAGGTGIWLRPGSGPGTTGNQSLSVKVNGTQVLVSRVHSIAGPAGTFATATMLAHHENGMITGSGPEQNSGGRTCTINLTR
jgi:peptidoglycan hydrolase-like protein with peptidoglycan-binding domain